MDDSFEPEHAGRFQPPGFLSRCFHNGASLLSLLTIPFLSGCLSPAKFRSPDRLDRGYIIVLPGIEGTSPLNASLAKGLVDGGLPSAIEVYDWTAGSVFLFPVTLRYLDRNKKQAEKIADMIVAYQRAYPGRPVHLIGHSGGGGIAVLTLEALPPGHKVTSAILLAPAIAPDYDLRRAMSAAELGIWNFWSPYDVGFLQAGTFFMGTIDGRHTGAAGAKGFVTPWGLSEDDRRFYYSHLHQQRYTSKMAQYGHYGGHTGWSNQQFVAQWLSPLIYRQISSQTRFAADTAGHTAVPATPAMPYYSSEAPGADGSQKSTTSERLGRGSQIP